MGARNAARLSGHSSHEKRSESQLHDKGRQPDRHFPAHGRGSLHQSGLWSAVPGTLSDHAGLRRCPNRCFCRRGACRRRAAAAGRAAAGASHTGRRLSDRLVPHHDRLHRPCRRRLTGASAKYDRKLYAVLRYAEAGWVTHRPCSQMSKRIQICCGFSQKILLPPGGTGTLPIAAGFPWFFA